LIHFYKSFAPNSCYWRPSLEAAVAIYYFDLLINF